MIQRLIEQKIRDDFSRKKISLILGPRQVGKTTLLQQLSTSGARILHLNCDYLSDAQRLIDKSADELTALLSGFDMVQIDEAQKVKDIGLTLKKMGDLHLDTHILVTGSSALELANGIYDSAVGRVLEYRLFPFAMEELANETSQVEQDRALRQRLVYGLYPEVVNDPAHAEETIVMIANNYLYRDALAFKGMKKPDLLVNLLQALALQVGSEVSYNELGDLLHADTATIKNYISPSGEMLHRLPPDLIQPQPAQGNQQGTEDLLLRQRRQERPDRQLQAAGTEERRRGAVGEFHHQRTRETKRLPRGPRKDVLLADVLAKRNRLGGGIARRTARL